jgi:aminocarboxymuconate-semialdehyde decarboxylase
MTNLEVNLPHAGGAFPWLIGRLDHGARVRPELKHMKRVPSEYLRRFSYDRLACTDQASRGTGGARSTAFGCQRPKCVRIARTTAGSSISEMTRRLFVRA